MPEIEVLIKERAKTKFTKGDLLEDYWFDFLWFRKEALTSDESGDRIQTHRFLRAGLFAFLSYLNGLENRWRVASDESTNAGSSLTSLSDRLGLLAGRFQVSHPPRSDIEFVSDLVSRSSNLHPSDEPGLFQALSVKDVEAAEAGIVTWLGVFVEASGLAFHSETRSLVMPAIDPGRVFSRTDYSAFDALKDDPRAFQDPPGTWDDPESNSDSVH